jgi:aspartate carbamoyltransferase catalytic subunit
MSPDMIVLRHASSGACHLLSRICRAGIINAGDGMHEHPTQALLDAFTMWRHLGNLDGRRVAIVGDVLHSRVARSNVLLLRTLGAEVTLVAPPTLLPTGVDSWPAEVSYDLDAVLPKSDVVMMLRVQRERMGAAYFPSAREYSRRYGLDADRAASLQDHTIVMHPGPMVRGMEIASEVADGLRSTIVDQVANGVSVRMAVLYLLLGGAEPAIGVSGEASGLGPASAAANHERSAE